MALARKRRGRTQIAALARSPATPRRQQPCGTKKTTLGTQTQHQAAPARPAPRPGADRGSAPRRTATRDGTCPARMRTGTSRVEQTHASPVDLTRYVSDVDGTVDTATPKHSLCLDCVPHMTYDSREVWRRFPRSRSNQQIASRPSRSTRRVSRATFSTPPMAPGRSEPWGQGRNVTSRAVPAARGESAWEPHDPLLRGAPNRPYAALSKRSGAQRERIAHIPARSIGAKFPCRRYGVFANGIVFTTLGQSTCHCVGCAA